MLTALLRMLRDCAVAARDDAQREEINSQVQLVAAETSPELLPEDVNTVNNIADRVRLALTGRVEAAYSDRAGETRSL